MAAPVGRGIGKRRGAPALDEATYLARRRGALLGLAVGDALGVTMVSKHGTTAPPFPALATGPQVELRGGGPYSVKPGQGSVATQLAGCTAQVLRTLHRYDRAEAVAAYRRWAGASAHKFAALLEVLEAISGGATPERASMDAWVRGGRREQGNEGLARAVPLGVFFAKEREARIQACLEDAAITHFDLRCRLAAVALAASIAKALTALAVAKPEELLAAAESDLVLASVELGRATPEHVQAIQTAGELLRADLAAARASDPKLYGPELHLCDQRRDQVRAAFRLAYWELLHAPSPEAALVDVVNRGGSAATNAAVAGALQGALRSESQLPARWVQPVLDAPALAQGPLYEALHPRGLLELLK